MLHTALGDSVLRSLHLPSISCGRALLLFWSFSGVLFPVFCAVRITKHKYLLCADTMGMLFTHCACNACNACNVHAVRTQCKVLYVGNYLNPSFRRFTSLLFHNRLFYASCALRMWHI